jgi:hypothetical protein
LRFSLMRSEGPVFFNISQPTELQDVVNAIRVIAEMQRVQQVISGGIIIIEGTAEQVAVAEKLATEIHKGKRRFGGLGYRIDLKRQESEEIAFASLFVRD